MHVIVQLASLLRLLGVLMVRQYTTEPFRTYGLLRLATLVFGSLAVALGVAELRALLSRLSGSRGYVPAFALLLTLSAVALFAVRLVIQRYLNLRSLPAALSASFLSAASERLLGRAFPRTLLPVFLVLAGLQWLLAAAGIPNALRVTPLPSLALMLAVTTYLVWWTIGEDSEASDGALLWPASRRPLRFFPAQYDTKAAASWIKTARILDLPLPDFRALSEPDAAAASAAERARRQLLAEVTTGLTARLATIVPPDQIRELARTPLPALGGASVLALLRRALTPSDPFGVADFYIRVAGLTESDLARDDWNAEASG